MVAVVGMWVEALLVVIILLLLGIILFSGGGVIRRRKFLGEINSLRKEVQRLQDANEALRSAGVRSKERGEHFVNMFEIVKDIDDLRCAVGGSTACQRVLGQKYGVKLGPELLERILATQPGIDLIAKRKLADELLVGEVGRGILRSLESGARLEKAASDAGVSVSVSRALIARLQTLGYLDTHLKLTEWGRKALA